MEQRKDGRARVSIEVQLVRDGATAVRGSLLDLSANGARVSYLPADVVRELAAGDEVEIAGTLMSGTFRLRGRVRRWDAMMGEIGLDVDAENAAAVRALLDAPVAGAE